MMLSNFMLLLLLSVCALVAVQMLYTLPQYEKLVGDSQIALRLQPKDKKVLTSVQLVSSHKAKILKETQGSNLNLKSETLEIPTKQSKIIYESLQENISQFKSNLRTPEFFLEKNSQRTKAHEVTTSMIFVNNSRLLWCPAAKAGTTYIYSLLNQYMFPNSSFDPNHRCERYRKCGHDIDNIDEDKLICIAKPRCDIDNESAWGEHFHLIEEEAKNRFSFTSVRNPWDRLFSAYNNKIETKELKAIRLNGTHIPIKNSSDIISFSEFVRYVSRQTDEEMNGHWQSFAYRCHTSGENKFSYDAVLRLEDDFKTNVENVFSRAGIELPSKSNSNKVHSNTGSQKKQKYLAKKVLAYYEGTDRTELVDLVRKVYKADIEEFNYTYTGFDWDELKEEKLTSSMAFIDKNLLWCPMGSSIDTTTTYKVLAFLFEINNRRYCPSKRQKRCGNSVRWGLNRDCLIKKDLSCPIEENGLDWNTTSQLLRLEARKRISFAVTRNPWDRIMYAFENFIKTRKLKNIMVSGEKVSTKLMTFSSFVKAIASQAEDEMHPEWQKASYRCHTSGKDFFPYDYIIRYEDGLTDDIRSIMKEAGYNKWVTRIKVNKQKIDSKRVSFYVNQNDIKDPYELVNLISQTYSADIHTSKYKFTGPSWFNISEAQLTESMVYAGEEFLWCPVPDLRFDVFQHVFRLSFNINPPYVTAKCKNNSAFSCLNIKTRVSFTTVRNPWDRLYDVYYNHFLKKESQTIVSQGKKHPVESFKDFIRIISSQELSEMDPLWQPYGFRCHTCGENAFPYDRIIKHEDRLSEAAKEIYEKAGFDTKSVPEHINDPPRSVDVYSAYIEHSGLEYPRELVDRVAKMYSCDIERFGYKFFDSFITEVEPNQLTSAMTFQNEAVLFCSNGENISAEIKPKSIPVSALKGADVKIRRLFDFCDRPRKCGSSLTIANRPCLSDPSNLCSLEPDHFWNETYKHLAVEAMKRESFVLVRNPWDRVYSFYKKLITKQDGNTSFSSFVRSIESETITQMKPELQPLEYRCHTSGDDEFPYDKIIFYENDIYEEVFPMFVNLVPNQKEEFHEKQKESYRPRNSKNRGVDIRKETNNIIERFSAYTQAEGLKYPNELVHIIARKYSADISRFGYSFHGAKWQQVSAVQLTPSMVFAGKNLLWCPTTAAGQEVIFKILKAHVDTSNAVNSKTKCNRWQYCGTSIEDKECVGNSDFSCSVEVNHGLWQGDVETLLQEANRRLSFTVVQNPWYRVYRAYKKEILTGRLHVIKVKGKKVYAKISKELPFTRFVRIIGRQNPDEMSTPWKTFENRCHTTGDNALEYDVVLRYEDGIVNGMKKVLAYAGFDSRICDFQKINSDEASYLNIDDEIRSAYFPTKGKLSHPTELIDIVARVYANDIQKFGYTFPFEQ